MIDLRAMKDEEIVLYALACFFSGLALLLCVFAVLALCGVIGPASHPGQHCVQKTLTHHAKLSDSWDCTKWAKND